MADVRRLKKETKLENEIEEMHIENGVGGSRRASVRPEDWKQETDGSLTSSPHDHTVPSASQSPAKLLSRSQSPVEVPDKHEQVVGGGVTLKMEPGQPPKLARNIPQKVVAGPPKLFLDCPSKLEEAQKTFQVLPECIYTSKYIGSTEHDSMECDCAEEWDGDIGINAACGDDSDCINRATKMECVGDCGCGADCQNQRFQRQQFADVTVFKTEKKGYGLRADTDMRANEFIYEYIGEVINEGQFRKRMLQYDEEGIKHFYFMSLNKGEFVDATKKGNLGRFCNHSCNPNCYVDKWVVGEKLRMGIFAERAIKAGEELVFNYNVDRYGADPQPCYCGEPNCTGFIGGKTQTERATKLSNATIEALGIDDGDGWDTAVAKKPRKKKVGEDDEEYVNNVPTKSLDENGVTKVMATLMQCKEKWIAVKLLDRIQRCEDERVRNRVVKMHGYQILNSTLIIWKEDANVVLQVFDVLDKFPRLTRNKISDSKIEATVEGLKASGDERVQMKAAHLLAEWSTLEVAYRIPRKKREPGAGSPEKQANNRFGRRDSSREERKARSVSPKSPKSRSRSRSMDAPRGPAAPTGPRSGFPARPAYYPGPRPSFRPRPFNALPSGWFMATDQNGRQYYYDHSGKTTWERPTQPAAPPPPPPKPTSNNKALEDIINEITSAKANTPKDKPAASVTPQSVPREKHKDEKTGSEKWRTFSEEKQRRIYENTLFPHIKSVMDKFKGKLPKDDLKRFAKEISKKLVNSDYKNQRVQDPTKISDKQAKQVKKYVKEFFDRAVEKDKERQKRKAERKAHEAGSSKSSHPAAGSVAKLEEDQSDEEKDIDMSDNEEDKIKLESTTPITPLDQMSTSEGLKRKRDGTDDVRHTNSDNAESTPSKRLKSETPPPVPPPPPPAPENGDHETARRLGDDDELEDMDMDSLPFEAAIEAISKPPPPPPDADYPSHEEDFADDIAGQAHDPHQEALQENGDADRDGDGDGDGEGDGVDDKPELQGVSHGRPHPVHA